jgi:Flp pilus assembly pilin Flp
VSPDFPGRETAIRDVVPATQRRVRGMTDAVIWLVVRAQNLVADVREREEGQTFVEYALLLAGIAILLIVAILFLKDRIANLFSNTGSSLSNPVGGGS